MLRWSGMSDPYLHVTEEAWGEQRPRAAYIHITLTADKLFSGRAALDKAIELRKLVHALAEHDFPESAVSLTGATLDVSSGLFTRSSSVTYRVRLHVLDVERLPDAFDAISEAKQARISHLEWDYPNAGSDELLAECATRALAKAKKLASAMSVAIVKMQSLHAEQIAEAAPHPLSHGHERVMMMAMRRAKSIGEELVGLDLGPTQRIGVRVKIAYAIS